LPERFLWLAEIKMAIKDTADSRKQLQKNEKALQKGTLKFTDFIFESLGV